MLTPPEAARTILEHVAPLPTERRPLKEVLDLVLAEDVVSPIDLPGWDNSAMDGYATRAADVGGATADRPVPLNVIETVPAGRFPTKAVGAGEAIRITREGVRQDLQRHLAIQFSIARAIHLAHSARAERIDDLVWADSRSHRHGHGARPL